MLYFCSLSVSTKTDETKVFGFTVNSACAKLFFFCVCIMSFFPVLYYLSCVPEHCRNHSTCYTFMCLANDDNAESATYYVRKRTKCRERKKNGKWQVKSILTDEHSHRCCHHSTIFFPVILLSLTFRSTCMQTPNRCFNSHSLSFYFCLYEKYRILCLYTFCFNKISISVNINILSGKFIFQMVKKMTNTHRMRERTKREEKTELFSIIKA